MTLTTHISAALYRYMCQHIVGTEQSVKTRRLFNTVNDCCSEKSTLAHITSGSFGEGLEMVDSDRDYMLVMNNVNVYESIDFKFDPDTVTFVMDTVDIKPGYTKLKCLNQVYCYRNSCISCIKTGHDFYLTNYLFKNKMRSIDTYFTFHGPCLSDPHGMIDIAVCLQSKAWITPASRWLQRACNEWPCHEVKAKAVDYGVLFVPIGVKGSDYEEFEWRISFSVAEIFLIYSFNHTQLLCYALMKILLTDIIERDDRCKRVLCSYYIKTTLFWVSEEQPLSVWTPENLIPCFSRCFQRLIYCVEYSICPHYFITENNMFENRIEGSVRDVLLENLSVLYSKGWRCLLLSQQMSQFKPHIRIEFQSFQESVRNVINSNGGYGSSESETMGYADKKGTTVEKIINFMKHQSPKSNYVYGISVASIEKAHSIQLTTGKANKETYKQYNNGLSYFLMATHHDSVSGWLMLASFFYKMKQYRLALNILLYSLSKCTREQIMYGQAFSNEQCQLLSLEIWKSMGLLRTIAVMCVKNMWFKPWSRIIPQELDINGLPLYCPPVVFAHFMCFLCHYHLRDVRQYRNSLRDLHRTIAEEYFVPTKNDKCIGYSCLGISLQLTGDRESARVAFIKAIDLGEDTDYKIVPLHCLSVLQSN